MPDVLIAETVVTLVNNWMAVRFQEMDFAETVMEAPNLLVDMENTGLLGQALRCMLLQLSVRNLGRYSLTVLSGVQRSSNATLAKKQHVVLFWMISAKEKMVG